MAAGKQISDEQTLLSVELLATAQVAQGAKVSAKTIYRSRRAKCLSSNLAVVQAGFPPYL